ncbi:MAG TPA: hypothetical protein VF320_03870, partial [Acidimicrobiales bacterium]
MIGVALKWVDLRPEVDPLSGAVHDDAHSFGCSPADQAALEWALRLAGSWSQNAGGPPEVVVVTAGPAAAEALLRDALAAGADRAVRVELITDAPSDEVALALGDVLADAALVCCGDYSVDRGSGSVPAYLAARLGAAQALGLVHVEPGAEALRVIRRLDHGRREVLSLATGAGAPPAVLSVEGSSADLRRASLAAVLAARDELIDVVAAPAARAARTKVT